MEGMGREMLTTLAFSREEDEGGEGEGRAMGVERGKGGGSENLRPLVDGAPSKKRKLERGNGTNGFGNGKDMVLNPDAAHAMQAIKVKYNQLRDRRLENMKSHIDLNEYYRGVLAHAQRLLTAHMTVGEVIKKRVVEFRNRCHELRVEEQNIDKATIAARWDNCEYDNGGWESGEWRGRLLVHFWFLCTIGCLRIV